MDKTIRIVRRGEPEEVPPARPLTDAEIFQRMADLTETAWFLKTGKPFPRMDRSVVRVIRA